MLKNHFELLCTNVKEFKCKYIDIWWSIKQVGERANQSKTHFREYLYNDKCYAHETCIYDSLYVRLHAVKNSLQVIMY